MHAFSVHWFLATICMPVVRHLAPSAPKCMLDKLGFEVALQRLSRPRDTSCHASRLRSRRRDAFTNACIHISLASSTSRVLRK